MDIRVWLKSSASGVAADFDLAWTARTLIWLSRSLMFRFLRLTTNHKEKNLQWFPHRDLATV